MAEVNLSNDRVLDRSLRPRSPVMKLPAIVLLSTEEQDLGLVDRAQARSRAAREGRPDVYVRDPVSDHVRGQIEPN